jgi:predicted transcriptional regulator
MATTTTIGVKLEKSVAQRLKALGQRTERSPHWLLKKAVAEYLSREEEREREAQEDEERWDEYVLGGRYITQERMMQLLDQLKRGKKVTWPK